MNDSPMESHGVAPADLISVKVPDAVRMTGLSRSRIYELIASGDIEAAKLGRSTVVLVSSLRSLIHANRRIGGRRS